MRGQLRARINVWYAADDGDYKECETLIRRGADVNDLDEHHHTPLYRAAIGGHLDVSKLLLDHGADPNIASKSNHKLFKY